MARRRLAPPDAAAPAPAPEVSRAKPSPGAAPIARVALESAAAAADRAAALRAEAEAGSRAAARLAAAEAEGRVLLDVALTAIETGYIARDRMPAAEADDAFAALKASLADSGQRVPVELVDLGAGRYGLIAGWRRVQALGALRAETGEARFATVRALVRPEADRASAFRAMVEENEIRADLGHYERGRICALAAEAGAYPDADAALAALFAAGSPARRSKIRSFMALHAALGDLLAWPERIPERLGLALAGALKAGRGPELRAALAGRAVRWRGPGDEQAGLRAILAGRPVPGEDAGHGAAPPPRGSGGNAGGGSGRERVELASGIRVERRLRDGRAELRLSGPGLDEAAVEAAFAAVLARLGGDGQG